MLLGEILNPDVVRLRLDAEDKFEAIEELVDLLIQAHELPMSLRDHAIEVVTARENSMSTGMEHGVALPHGTSDKITSIVAALALCPDGLPFESLDGEDARLVLLLLMPRDNYQGHVRTLAGIAHLLGNQAFREALINAEDVSAVMRLIQSEEDKEVFNKLRE
jgi:mannitol/fructose-specific phosphotransferase system IIA component (Ntr-type)